MATSGQLLDSLRDVTIAEQLDEDGLRQAITTFWDEANALACMERRVQAGARRSWSAKDASALRFFRVEIVRRERVLWVAWPCWTLRAGQVGAQRQAAVTAS